MFPTCAEWLNADDSSDLFLRVIRFLANQASPDPEIKATPNPPKITPKAKNKSYWQREKLQNI